MEKTSASPSLPSYYACEEIPAQTGWSREFLAPGSRTKSLILGRLPSDRGVRTGHSCSAKRFGERMYAMVYGMIRTTVYLPEALKESLERAARQRGCSEAELIREGVRQVVESSQQQLKPRIPLFASGLPDLAEKADELLPARTSSRPASRTSFPDLPHRPALDRK